MACLWGGRGGFFLTFKTSWPNVKGNTKRLFKKDKGKKGLFFLQYLVCFACRRRVIMSEKTNKKHHVAQWFWVFVLNARLHILQSLLQVQLQHGDITTVFLKASSLSLLLPKGEIKDSFLSPKPSDVPADHIKKIHRTRVELASAPAPPALGNK